MRYDTMRFEVVVRIYGAIDEWQMFSGLDKKMQIFEKEVPKSVSLTDKELENLVFGTELTFGREEEQQEKSSENETAAEETRDEEINDFGFFIDTGNAENDEKVNENGFSLSEEEGEEQEDDVEGEQDSSDEETMCAWVDGDQDYLESVNIQEKNRTRKLKRSFDEINVTGKASPSRTFKNRLINKIIPHFFQSI